MARSEALIQFYANPIVRKNIELGQIKNWNLSKKSKYLRNRRHYENDSTGCW